MVQYCVVPLCKSNAFTPGVSFHSFPQDNSLRKQWIIKMRRDEKHNAKVSPTMRVCSRHFLPEHIIPSKNGLRKLLRKDAVPCVFDFTPPKKIEPRRIFWLETSPWRTIQPSERARDSSSDTTTSLTSLQDEPSFGESTLDDVDEVFVSENVLANNLEKFETENIVLQAKIAGVHGLKRRTLKRNAVPSLNLPISPEYTGRNENTTKSKKTKKSKARKSEGMTPEKRKLICPDKTSSQKSSGNQEEIWSETSFADMYEEHVDTSPCITRLCVMESAEDQEKEKRKTSSNSDDEIYEEHMDTAPCITRLCVTTDDYSSVGGNITEHSSENLEKDTQNCTVPLTPTKYKEDSEFDYSIFKSSFDDSKETLTEKLDGMISVNELLHKKIKFYQNKCKMYEKEVNIMKGVIDNLKLINSVTFDN